MNLDTQLAQLTAAQLVRQLDEDEPAYQFKHALTQDAAYALLLKADRVRLHRRVAGAYETLYADRIDEYAAVLAEHYTVAADDAKAMEFSMRAGDAAARVYANVEALAHYTRSLDLARRTPTTGSQFFCDLLLRRGRVLELSSQFKAALEHYEDMERLAQARGDRALELAALAAQCQIRCTPNSEFNLDLGEGLANRTAQLARALGDRAVEAKVYWGLLNLYRFANRSAQALAAGEQSIAIARELNLREQLAYTLNDMSHVYTFQGNFDQAKTVLEQATRLWRELNNLPMLADSLATAAQNGSFSGDYQNTLAASEQAFKISQSIANLWGQSFSLSSVGLVHWARGDPGRAIASMEETLRLSDLSGYLIPQAQTRADLAVVYAKLGATERGIELAERALEFADADFAWMRPYVGVSLIQVYLLAGKLNQAAGLSRSLQVKEGDYAPLFTAYLPFGILQLAIAQNDYARVLNLAPGFAAQLRSSGLRPFVPEVLCMLARAQRALGQLESAEESLNQGRVEAQALGSRWDLWQIFAALAGIETARGNSRAADHHRDQAREIISYIGEHLPSDSLRASFLTISHLV